MNPSERKRLATVLAKVRHLIERLRATEPSPGCLTIEGRNEILFDEATETLVRLRGGIPDLGPLSRKAASDLVVEAAMAALKVGPGETISERTNAFVDRHNRAIADLRRAILANAGRWTFVTIVRGLNPQMLPYGFGGTTFTPSTPATLNKLALMATGRYRPTGQDGRAKQAIRRSVRQRRALIRTEFAEHAVASCEVAAIDSNAAQALGMEKIRRCVDAMNFFAPFSPLPWDYGRAAIEPRRPLQLPWIAQRRRKVRLSGHINLGRASVNLPGMSTESAAEIGLARASTLFASLHPTEFDQRIMTSLSWAGRARAELRRDQAFMFWVIALEGVLKSPDSRAAITDRFRLRVAQIVATTASGRKTLYEKADELYRIRNAIVHSGDGTSVTESDEKWIAELATRTLTRLLTDPEFVRMRNMGELEAWFQKRMLGGSESG